MALHLKRLVLATRNLKKRRELEALLLPLAIEIQTLDHYPAAPAIVEDGASFAENASKKATQTAKALGEWTLGEDSGLAVDSLGGAPGIFSARYAGMDATDQANNELLLQNMKGVPPSRRTAHYVCYAAIADPQGGIVREAEGHCFGRIREEPSGQGGFGYDPLFEIPEYHRTFGEITAAVKQIVSHRARALRELARWLSRQG
ncbi:MAG TPA: RdgB/HAM1 family non-canonical purine NTP pyrophosphatase [Pirellulaceae bacterium]